MSRLLKTAVWVSLLVGLGSAQAYIPPVSFLLQRWVQIRTQRQVFHLKVKLQTTVVDEGQERRGEETQYYLMPWKFRSELKLDDGTRLRIRDGKRELRQRGGDKPRVRKTGIDLIADFLSAGAEGEEANGQARDRLVGQLEALGIDSSKLALSRFDGRIAIVIGADPWDSEAPQLWLDKDGLFPLRLVRYSGKDRKGPRVEKRLLGWGGSKGGTFFPELIEVYRDGQLVRRSRLSSLDAAARVTSSQFKIP